MTEIPPPPTTFEELAAILAEPRKADLAREIRIESIEDADLWLAKPVGTEELVFRLTDAVLDARRLAFRERLPHAVLRPIAPYARYTLNRPEGTSNPREVLDNYAELPPITQTQKYSDGNSASGRTSTFIGSGVPKAEHPLAAKWFSRCMWCASEDTLIVYASSSHFSNSDGDDIWDECSYVCRECKRSSYHQVHLGG